jgi:hypothetical protein
MFDKQKFPKLDCQGFLERAFVWLKVDGDVEFFYAALELRFTVERLLLKHGFASEDYSDSFARLNWKPKELQQKLVKEFDGRLDMTKAFRFTLNPNDVHATMGYYLPVTKDMFKSYKDLNGYLHAQWAVRMGTPDRAWAKKAHASMFDFATRLIPHASPRNSLNHFTIPNIQAVEMDRQELESLLRQQSGMQAT